LSLLRAAAAAAAAARTVVSFGEQQQVKGVTQAMLFTARQIVTDDNEWMDGWMDAARSFNQRPAIHCSSSARCMPCTTDGLSATVHRNCRDKSTLKC